MPSCRNQSIDLQSTSINWFLYDGNLGIFSELNINFWWLLCNEGYSTKSDAACLFSKISPIQEKMIQNKLQQIKLENKDRKLDYLLCLG